MEISIHSNFLLTKIAIHSLYSIGIQSVNKFVPYDTLRSLDITIVLCAIDFNHLDGNKWKRHVELKIWINWNAISCDFHMHLTILNDPNVKCIFVFVFVFYFHLLQYFVMVLEYSLLQIGYNLFWIRLGWQPL